MENELKSSIDYINKKTTKETGFSIPSNYLNNLEDTILLKISEENLSNNSGFKTPQNYFDTLEHAILSKVITSKKEPKVISFKERVFKIIPFAAAASIVLFISLNSFIFNTNDKLTFDSLNDTDIEYWLENNNINTMDISEIIAVDILKENDFSMANISDENIEEYINSIDDIIIIDEID
ncbi:hypothetical protein [uncultured Polaribacter sp.]|uniref:hypothetical protein n=1 Tax=uncultured Polaribacter sp. TaxID=174711 RepID=UPI0026198519|nr:hypothetical protein [uncultured Polaribacter sp.]